MLKIATLNSKNICIGIKEVGDHYEMQPGDIAVSAYDANILNKTYIPDTGEFIITQEQIEEEALHWRDSELLRTDPYMLLPDFPEKDRMSVYRQALRDWPATAEFPDTKPEY